MAISIRLAVDGTPVTVEIESRTLLARFLREQRRLTGAHFGCDSASCGACTVHFNGHGRAIESCDRFAVQRDGMDATVVEGPAQDGIPRPVRAAFSGCHDVQQCGYRTPGMAMRPVAGAAGRANLDGDLCRCPGHHSIEKAILAGTEARCAGARAASRGRPKGACHECPRSQPRDRHAAAAAAAQGDRRRTHWLSKQFGGDGANAAQVAGKVAIELTSADSTAAAGDHAAGEASGGATKERKRSWTAWISKS